ncbi:hypothetical protein [Haliscomenobacter hydrossis]|uniref:Outer membrane protein beta-barrel domain-containing protein n=1 Tax=Haliscomenobacter hydrossis (strain ATCC 27775 / DSM 1100 / LMG 10767 / O) TaxID=760192 RepID=F4KZ29_HALH1|nr:hypothetical protein [Haliscomenobacter hydrossis]AEE53683.1 hypothetical protein Halhy_5860 [Haliscomenobacter hydrossis DSM 1100]
MNYFILLFSGSLFILLNTTLPAQAPGYLGKRLSLQADLMAFPALGGPTAGNRGSVFYGENGGGFAFNWKAGASLDYVVSRKRQVRLLLDVIKTGMSETYYTPSSSALVDGQNDSHDLFFNLNGVSLGLGTRGYNLKKGALAPLGPYVGWSLRYTMITGEILDKRTSYAFRGPHAPLGLDLKTNRFSLGYSFGSTLIVADNIILDFGANFNADIPIANEALDALNYGDEFPAPIEPSGDYVKDNNKRYDKDVAFRVFKHSLFFFHVGAGFLIR